LAATPEAVQAKVNVDLEGALQSVYFRGIAMARALPDGSTGHNEAQTPVSGCL